MRRRERQLVGLGEGTAEIVDEDRLEEIVDGIDFERLESVLVVGGGEDDHAPRHHFVERLEDKAVVQTDVGNYEVEGGVLLEGFNHLFNGCERTNDIKRVVNVADESLQTRGTHTFVFYDEYAFHISLSINLILTS